MTSPSPDGTVIPPDAQAPEGGTRIEAPDVLLEFMARQGVTDWHLDDGRTVIIMAIERPPGQTLKQFLDTDTLADYAAKLGDGT